jgi:tetratricopeptide (TPR) repeat protein
LLKLALLFGSIGNYTERKRLLERTLRLERERGGDDQVAFILRNLSDASRSLGLFKEGIGQAREALGIYERIGGVEGQGDCLVRLALLLREDNQLDAAEEAASRAIKVLPEKGQEWEVCVSHRTLGFIYCSKGEKEKAIHHFETGLKIASPFGWSDQLFWIHYGLAELFRDEDDFNNAHVHIEQAKTCTVDDRYLLGRTILLQARIYLRQNRFEDSSSEALRALEIFEGFGAQRYAEKCKDLLQDIERRATKS